MKIYDCFMYFDEDLILNLRLNTLDKYVDYFVIVESSFAHNGEKRKLKFNISKFSKFKKKIIYLVYDEEPNNIYNINKNDIGQSKTNKLIWNAIYRENGQRNFIMNGLNHADNNDLILISDVDEIPNLKNIELKNIKQKIILFQQDMFYYKFDLKIPNIKWTGTKACRKKNLISPQWLRNVKDRKYLIFRLDIIFSKQKYNSVKIINNGGWHFTNIKTAKEIETKLKSYLHHIEFEQNPLSSDEIENIIKEKRAIYNLNLDQRKNKIGKGDKLEKIKLDDLPIYLKENRKEYEMWLD